MKLPPPFRLFAASACSTCAIASPYETSLSGSTCTWYSRVSPPKMDTDATLGTDIRCLKTTQSCSAFKHLVLTRLATENGHRRNIRHRHQVLENYPVLQRLQVHDVVLRVRALQGIEVDLTGRTEVRTDLRIQTRRQTYQRELFQHLLPVLQIVGLVIEQDGNERKPCQRGRAQMGKVSDTIQLCLDWNRDLLFHLFRRASRPLRDDPNILVGHIGIGFDGQIVEGDDSPDEQQQPHGQHEHAVAQRKINQEPDHAALFLRRAGKLQRIGHDLIARFQSADNLLRSIFFLCPKLHRNPPELVLSRGKEYPVLVVQMDDRRCRHYDALHWLAGAKRRRHEHARAHDAMWIG